MRASIPVVWTQHAEATKSLGFGHKPFSKRTMAKGSMYHIFAAQCQADFGIGQASHEANPGISPHVADQLSTVRAT